MTDWFPVSERFRTAWLAPAAVQVVDQVPESEQEAVSLIFDERELMLSTADQGFRATSALNLEAKNLMISAAPTDMLAEVEQYATKQLSHPLSVEQAVAQHSDLRYILTLPEL